MVRRQSPKELGGCTCIHVHVHYSRLFVYAARRRVQSMHATVKFQASRRISYVSCPSLPPPYAWTPYRYRQILKKKLVPYDGVSYEEELEVGRRNRADA